MTSPQNVPYALYRAMAEYIALDSIQAQQKQEIIQRAMENRAIRTLEAIRHVLEDKTFDDPECFYRIDALVMLYWRELGIRIDRHSEVS